MKRKTFYFISLIAGTILVIFDQWTKQLAIDHLFEQEDLILIHHVLQLHYLRNTGAAFSILQGRLAIFFVLTPILCLIILYFYMKLPVNKRYLPLHIICVFLLAGAVGNLIDRIRFGYVTDFIYFSLIDFPVFNVADIYVTCSISVLVLLLLFVYKDDELSSFT